MNFVQLLTLESRIAHRCQITYGWIANSCNTGVSESLTVKSLTVELPTVQSLTVKSFTVQSLTAESLTAALGVCPNCLQLNRLRSNRLWYYTHWLCDGVLLGHRRQQLPSFSLGGLACERNEHFVPHVCDCTNAYP